jgi:hypothetical protein
MSQIIWLREEESRHCPGRWKYLKRWEWEAAQTRPPYLFFLFLRDGWSLHQHKEGSQRRKWMLVRASLHRGVGHTWPAWRPSERASGDPWPPTCAPCWTMLVVDRHRTQLRFFADVDRLGGLGVASDSYIEILSYRCMTYLFWNVRIIMWCWYMI